MSFSSQRGQSQQQASTTKIMSILGALAAAVFAIALPGMYCYISITGTQQTHKVEVAFLAKAIEKIIQARPDLWEYETIRLKDVISQPSIRGEMDEREISSAAGKLIAKNDFTEARPIISVTAPLFDAGRLAGSIAVRASIRIQVITTALLGILSSLLGCLFYYIFRTYPLRKLENTLTDLQRAQEVEQQSREASERLASEMSVIAEIGQVISSTLDIAEVYERFAAEARKLIPFDRLSVNLNNHDQKTITVAYAFGPNAPGRSLGDSFPRQGSVNESLERTRTGMLLHPTNVSELTGQYPHLAATFQAGINSFMSVPLISRDEVIGVLHFRSKKPNAYAEHDLHLAERIGGQIAGAIASAQMFNDLNKTEKSLRESEEHYRTLVEQTGCLINNVDGKGCITYVNDNGEKIFGKKKDELIGLSAFQFIHPDDQARTEEWFNECISNHVSLSSFENRQINASTGEVFHTMWSSSFIYDEKGQIKGVNSIAQDITLRKQTEAKLKESEERFRLAINATKDGLWEWNIQTNQEIFSPRWCEIIGYSFDDPALPHTYDSWASRIHSDDHDRVIKAMKDHLENGTEYNVDYRHRHKSGEYHWQNSRGQAIFDQVSGKPIKMVGCISDITERKKAETEKTKLEAQNRQLQKSESLGRMAGAIAHTFNNQLGVVIGNLEMAMDDMPQGTGFLPGLTAAMQAAQKAATVSGQMLTYLGQTPGIREPLDLSNACLRGLPMLRAIIPGEVMLETELPSPGPIINANANLIQQVLTNLVTNAWEAVGDGRGAIHLRVNTVSPAQIPTVHRYPVRWQPQNKAYACLEVTDAGGGIADKDIEKLFDPFFSSKFTGRGMGLAVVMGIVKAHGGVITVESKPGMGSAFRVFLPVSAVEVPRQPDPVAQPLATEEGGTILLVEDEEMVREMAAAMLKRLGYSVIEAKDGVEAVDLFRERRDEIRLVISDLTMPRMNGWETLTALRQLVPGIPVILASGYDKAQVMAGDHPELPQVFLGKPYKLKGLSDAIGQALVNEG